MKISFERSGGFAGMIMAVSLDTTELSPTDAKHLQSLVEASNFFQLPKVIPATAQPDRFQYHFTIQEKKRSHSVTVSESSVPGTLRPLLDWLMEVARRPKS